MYAQSFGIIGPANFGHDWSKQANFQPVSKHLLAHAKIQSLDIAWLTHWIGISQAKSWKLMQRQNPAMTNRLSTLESSCSGESSIRRTSLNNRLQEKTWTCHAHLQVKSHSTPQCSTTAEISPHLGFQPGPQHSVPLQELRDRQPSALLPHLPQEPPCPLRLVLHVALPPALPETTVLWKKSKPQKSEHATSSNLEKISPADHCVLMF